MKAFDYHTSTIYTLAFQAVCIAQFISKSRTVCKGASPNPMRKIPATWDCTTTPCAAAQPLRQECQREVSDHLRLELIGLSRIHRVDIAEDGLMSMGIPVFTQRIEKRVPPVRQYMQ